MPPGSTVIARGVEPRELGSLPAGGEDPFPAAGVRLTSLEAGYLEQEQQSDFWASLCVQASKLG